MFHSTKVRQVRILVAYLMLSVAVACLPGMAWAGDWTHDGTDGAATVVALPGGQATLARDGADRQARTITYVPANGTAMTITRAYGPSGHKAVEVENGTLRQHVYGAGLAPLLRVEGDGSLSYQIGPDTISVDATGGTTVAHLVTDIKQSTVAVLDAQGQPRQQVAYGTLGQSTSQSTSKQDSASVYAEAVRSRGYEGLSAWQLGTDQLIDNRARIYFTLAGRFLALDTAGKALGYEARGNNWITRADYDGNIDELIEMLQKDPSLVATFFIPDAKEENDFLFLGEFWQTIKKLEDKNIPFFIGSDSLLTENRQYSGNAQLGIGVDKRRVDKLIKDDLLRFVNSDSLIDYNREKFEGTNSEKIKLLFIRQGTFTDYMVGRESLRNFIFVSNETTQQNFMKQKLWKGRSVKQIMTEHKAQEKEEFQVWKPTIINIYTLSEIYEKYQISKLWPEKKEEMKLKAQAHQEMTKDQRIKKLQQLMNGDVDDNNQILPSQVDEEEEKQSMIQKKGNNRRVDNSLHHEEAEEESVEHQLNHGSCKGCILQ